MSDFPPAEPHGPIEEIFPDAYWVTGSVRFKPLVRLPRNMVVLRNGDELTLINAVRLNEEGEAALARLGTVRHVIRIGNHGMDDAYYIERYGAKHWAVPREGETSDVELTEDTELPIPDTRVFMFRDTKMSEAALLVEREGGLLITCDSIQHWAHTQAHVRCGEVDHAHHGLSIPSANWTAVEERTNPRGR